MLLKTLVTRMSSLTKDIDALYDVARNTKCSIEARLVAGGTLTYFLSSPSQPLEHWLLDTLIMRLGLCTAYIIIGQPDQELQADILLVKRELSVGAVRRIESILERLGSRAFAGGGMASLVMDNVALDRLYQQALSKAATAPDETHIVVPPDLTLVESLLAI